MTFMFFLLKGKLNPKLKQVEARDWKESVSNYNLPHLKNTLETWLEHTHSFGDELKEQALRFLILMHITNNYNYSKLIILNLALVDIGIVH